MMSSLSYDLWLHITSFIVPSCYKIKGHNDKDRIKTQAKALNYILLHLEEFKHCICVNRHPKVVNILYDDIRLVNWGKINKNTSKWAKKLISKFQHVYWEREASDTSDRKIITSGNKRIYIPILSQDDIKKEIHETFRFQDLNLYDVVLLFKYHSSDLSVLSKVSCLIPLKLLQCYPYKAKCADLCHNTHPEAIKLISKHPFGIDWKALSSNTCS